MPSNDIKSTVIKSYLSYQAHLLNVLTEFSNFHSFNLRLTFALLHYLISCYLNFHFRYGFSYENCQNKSDKCFVLRQLLAGRKLSK